VRRIARREGVLLRSNAVLGWAVQTRFLGRSDTMGGPPPHWQVTASNPWLDKPLQYDRPSRQAALTARRILTVLVVKGAHKEKVRSWARGAR
jgi:hypothetical protein